jgi:hypothetical protein
MEKTEEASQTPKKLDRIVSQALALGPKHDRIQAQWASNILLENMLERV